VTEVTGCGLDDQGPVLGRGRDLSAPTRSDTGSEYRR
jgi:hypothetical protein